jgi:ABC-type siderophore export system fused ATPase/permease subunit
MNKIAKWMTAALMSGVCGSALAQVTYSYQGSDFSVGLVPVVIGVGGELIFLIDRPDIVFFF